uniref:Uncharacterized protein n=1 Tax=Cacopsylla melanoneura TaxID=428564 RepID=A0A8D9DW78_9HEMI
MGKALDFLLGEEIGSIKTRETLKALVNAPSNLVALKRDEVNIISGALEMSQKKSDRSKTKDTPQIGNQKQTGPVPANGKLSTPVKQAGQTPSKSDGKGPKGGNSINQIGQTSPKSDKGTTPLKSTGQTSLITATPQKGNPKQDGQILGKVTPQPKPTGPSLNSKPKQDSSQNTSPAKPRTTNEPIPTGHLADLIFKAFGTKESPSPSENGSPPKQAGENSPKIQKAGSGSTSNPGKQTPAKQGGSIQPKPQSANSILNRDKQTSAKQDGQTQPKPHKVSPAPNQAKQKNQTQPKSQRATSAPTLPLKSKTTWSNTSKTRRLNIIEVPNRYTSSKTVRTDAIKTGSSNSIEISKSYSCPKSRQTNAGQTSWPNSCKAKWTNSIEISNRNTSKTA